MGLFSKNTGRILQDWIFEANAPIMCPATVADLHGKGEYSIIIGTKDGRILCLDEAGAERWSFKTNEQLSETESYFVDEERVHSIDAPPLVMDVNHDGKAEIITGTEMGMLYCLSAEGRVLWKHDCGDSIRAAPIADDINMDGKQEILIGSTNNKLTALSGNGELLFEFDTDAPVESVPGVLKKGKKLLIIFGNTAGKLIAITPAQDLIWELDLHGKITAAPEHLPCAEEERMVVGTLSGSMFCISEHGEIVWEFKTEGSIYNKAAVADLDNDKKHEIVFGSCDNSVYAITMDGNKMWSYETDFWVTGTPIIADINNDDNLEVVAGSYDHNVYILDSKGQYMMDYVPGVAGIVQQAGHYSNILTSEPGEQTGKKLYQFKLQSMVVGCTLLEHHGKHLLVTNTKTGQVSTLRHGK